MTELTLLQKRQQFEQQPALLKYKAKLATLLNEKQAVDYLNDQFYILESRGSVAEFLPLPRPAFKFLLSSIKQVKTKETCRYFTQKSVNDWFWTQYALSVIFDDRAA